MNSIRVLADDLTGALDTAAAFCGEIPVFIDTPPTADSPYWNAPVSVVSTPTRDVPVDALPGFLAPVVDWLRSGSLAYKKVDSLLRGNTFAEIAWLLQQGEFTGAIFAPAFPAQGRFTFDNRQWVKKAGEEKQPAAQPLREAFSEFRMTSGSMPENLGRGQDVWIPDVFDDNDLDRIASLFETQGKKQCLWCGSAGLAHAIARQQGIAPTSTKPPSMPGNAGPTVLISASFQPVFKQQWAMLRAETPAQPGLAIAEQACQEGIQAALKQIDDGAQQAWFDLSPPDRMSQEQAGKQLANQVTQLVSALPKPGQLIVVGGDTLLGLCRTTGATALLAGASARNGWGTARLSGGRWNDTPCYSRSGAFGKPDDLLMMIRQLENSAYPRKEHK